ncbi:uncharacterized protein DS421_11g326610 [Arachis hypogaea]|nr:uncharacterized protein DS421_11g326610 [Arachis hypogaea]
MTLPKTRCIISVSSSDPDANSQIFCDQDIKSLNLLLLGSNRGLSWLLLICVASSLRSCSSIPIYILVPLYLLAQSLRHSENGGIIYPLTQTRSTSTYFA